MRCLQKNSYEYHKINCLDENACSSMELCYKLVRKELQQAAEGRQVHSEPSTRSTPALPEEVTQLLIP